MTESVSLLKQMPIGLGCMNLSHGYGTPLERDQASKILRDAFEIGYRHFDTATLYGSGQNEQLLGKALKPVRSQIFLASKCAMTNFPPEGKVINGRPEAIKKRDRYGRVRFNSYLIHGTYQ